MEYEQLNIFSFLQEDMKENICGDKSYCWDNDVNKIHEKLISLAQENGLQILSDEFTIWPHVPQYGYRLWLDMEVKKDTLKNIEFQKDVQHIVEFSRERNIELSCMIGAVFFYNGEEKASLPFSTTFMDSKRRKVKHMD